MGTAVANARGEALLEDRLERYRAFASAHHDRAFRLAHRLLAGDAAAAEDVAQEAFLRAFRGLGRFREEATLGTWFTRILIREVQRHRRWQALRRVGRSDPIEEVDPPDRARPTRDPALRRRVAAALEQLSRRQREAFVLVHLEGFTVVETARLLGTSPGTVKTHLHRALRSLRRDLAELRGGGAQEKTT